LFNSGIRKYLKHRYKRIEAMRNASPSLQEKVLLKLIFKSKNTEQGKKYKFINIKSEKEFRNILPITDYENVKQAIHGMMNGEPDVLCPGKVVNYAKSSGTTNDRSKYIPMPSAMHYYGHVASSWDTMAIVYHEDPGAQIFERKSIIMGGSVERKGPSVIGDVSAILLKHMHWSGRPFFTPDFKTALLSDWEEKIEKMAHICSQEDVVMLGGVPTWTIVLCRMMLEITGANNMLEVWPGAKYYMHGGVGFDPYRNQFKELFPSKDFQYYEIYNASEGYFSVSDFHGSDGMLLLTNNNIYYEFLPVSDLYNDNPKTLTLEEVELYTNYAIVITTASGLCRYKLGDTVCFTSKSPYRIRVTGRTKQYINVFGEEVMVANTDKALAMTCEMLPAVVSEYTVAPVFLGKGNKGGHQWVIEFEKKPDSIEAFEILLDNNLKKINSDYEAKRTKDIALQRLSLHVVPSGTFHKWMRGRGKIGGQNKVPRLSNDRKYVEDILKQISLS